MVNSRFFLGLVLLTIAAGCSRSDPEPEPIRQLRTMQVGIVSDIRKGHLPGRARSAEEVDLAFDVSGSLIERPVAIGSRVEKGDLIARLDPTEFQARVKAAEADARNTERNFKRAQGLLEKSFISESEYDGLEADVDIAQAQLSLARKALSDSVIKAPFGGIIANLMVENFQSVPAKRVVARLLGTEQVEMVVNLSESQMAALAYIDTIEVEFDAFPGLRLPAEITEVGHEASSTTRTFPITLTMQQPEGRKILAGMAGVAHASGQFTPDPVNGYVIPIGALHGDASNNTNVVWIVGEDNRVSAREVTVGRLVDGGVKIVSGLQAGDLIATAGVHTLVEGQEVRVERSGG